MDDAAFDRALIAAAFQLAAEQGWRAVIVGGRGARRRPAPGACPRAVPRPAAILLRFGRLADQAALAEAPSDGTARDRLFDLLMRRIDALQAHRAGVLALLRALPADPPTALLLTLATRRSMRWMLQAAGIPTRGVSGELRVKGLVAVWLWTIRAWRATTARTCRPRWRRSTPRCAAPSRRPSGWAGGARAETPPEAGEPEADAEPPCPRRRLERRCAAAYQGRAAGDSVMATRSVATVFGGSGFIGRYIVKRLAAEGLRRARRGARHRTARCSSSRWARSDRWCRCTPR